MKKHFTNEQIIYALRQAEAGTPVLEICRIPQAEVMAGKVLEVMTRAREALS